jgi:hypothetical protein
VIGGRIDVGDLRIAGYDVTKLLPVRTSCDLPMVTLTMAVWVLPALDDAVPRVGAAGHE